MKVKRAKSAMENMLSQLDIIDAERREFDLQTRLAGGMGVALDVLITRLDDVQNLHARLKEIAADVNNLADYLSMSAVPDAMIGAGFTTVIHKIGRVSIATRVSASMLDKSKGIAWLKGHELGDLVIETVNHNTLSAQAKTMIEAGEELPSEIFKTSVKTYTSITRPGSHRTRKFRPEKTNADEN